MSTEVIFKQFGIAAIPGQVQSLFDEAIRDAHGTILSQVERTEDPAERGPSLQTEGGVLKFAVTLTVEIMARLGEDDVASVEMLYHVETKRPKFRAIRGSALMRRTGLLVESDGPDAVPLQFPKRSSRIG